MKKAVILSTLVTISPYLLAENEVTVDPQTLQLSLPTVIHQGARYSAKLDFNGSCFVVSELTPKSSQITITHDGFDFSSGSAPANWNLSDGYITSWTSHDYPANYAYGSGFWWAPYSHNSTTYPIIDMGEVSMESVVSVPTDWTYTRGTGIYPMMVGHVYVVKARDGYGKFKVVSLSGLEYASQGANFDPSRWSLVVEYGFTTGTSF